MSDEDDGPICDFCGCPPSECKRKMCCLCDGTGKFDGGRGEMVGCENCDGEGFCCFWDDPQ